MAKVENPPMDRGSTDSLGAFDHLLGREWEIEDEDWSNSSSGAKPTRSAKLVTIRLVKNASTVALLGKRLVRYQATSGNYGHRVDGYTSVTAQDWAGVVDEFLPAAGAAVGDNFFIVTKGPTKTLTPDASAAFNGDVAIGNALVAATAAASTGATAGRVAVIGATTAGLDHAINALGRALSAATTGQTATDVMSDIGRY